MKIKHKNSWETVSDFPHWEERHGIFGYITPSLGKVLFFYSMSGMLSFEDVTKEYEIIEL